MPRYSPVPRTFQSAPGFWAGRCARDFLLAADDIRGFNPRPAFGPGDARRPPPSWPSSRRFNPRPAFGPGDAGTRRQGAQHGRVSIRARLLGRAMRAMTCGSASAGWFQSAPGFWAGRCRLRAGRRGGPCQSFNPRPAFGPGDAVAQRALADADAGFNPRPAFGPGDACIGMSIRSCTTLFQSAPGFWAGRCVWDSANQLFFIKFQSAPGFWAGRCVLRPGWLRPRRVFQSAPGFWAGRCASACQQRRRGRGFNPRPAFGPGDAVWA